MHSLVRARTRLPIILVLLALLVLTSACAPLGTDLGGDPCLLKSYQGYGNGVLGGIRAAYNTLSGRLDALQSPHYTISSSQNISETLSAFPEFEQSLGEQRGYLLHGTQPPQGQSFREDANAAMARLDVGARLLVQAYVDSANGDTRASDDIVTAALPYMDQGRLLIARAKRDLAALNTNSVNC